MDCRKVKKRLNRYLDGKLSDSEELTAGWHVAACPDCRAALDRLRRADKMLAQLPEPPDPPAGLFEDIVVGVKRDCPRQSDISWRTTVFSPPMRIAAADRSAV